MAFDAQTLQTILQVLGRGNTAVVTVFLDPEWFEGRTEGTAVVTDLAFRIEGGSPEVWVEEELRYRGRDPRVRNLFTDETFNGWRRLAVPPTQDLEEFLRRAEAALGLDGLPPRVEPLDMEPSAPPLVSAPLPSPERAPKETFAEQFGRDLTALARQGKLPPVIGREREIQQVVEILLAQFKPNPLLIGEPGVGKTAIVEGFAQRIVEGKVPEPLRETRVVEVQLGALVAGASIQGELEGRIRRLIEEAENNAHLILFLDELHLINDPRYGGIVGNMLKPKLARGSLRVIGACTYRDYKAHLETDEALTRRFQVVLVNEPTEEQAIEMLKGLRPYLQQHHKVAIPDEVIEEAVRLSVRYFPDRFLPDKAIDLIDQACARLRAKATERALQAPCDREGHAENQREVSGNGTDLDG